MLFRTRKVIVTPASNVIGGSTSSVVDRVAAMKAGLMLSGHQDPYLVECITDKLFPNLSLEHGRSFSTGGGGGVGGVYSGGGGGAYGVGGGAYGGHSTLQLSTVRDGDRFVSLPSLVNDQNYGAMLSELVMHI